MSVPPPPFLLPFLPLETEPDGVTVAEADLVRSSVPTAPFEMARFTVPAGGTSSPDRHEVTELWVVQAGRGTLVVDGERAAVGPGSTAGFPPNAVHEVFADRGEELTVFSFWWPTADD